MKIQKIYIRNINSLAGEHTIDFTKPPLSTTALFAITGPTGAGKSTILDAICLALYDQCPRVGKATSAKIINSGAIITKGASETEAMVEFEQSGYIYRSRWTIQYNRKHNLNDRMMELSMFDIAESEKSKQWKLKATNSSVPTKNAEITNLDYGQFTRSILLAQGDFAKLLTSKKDERYALMEKITGDDTYRKLGKRIYEIASQKSKQIELVDNELKHIVFLTEEEKVAKSLEINTIKERSRMGDFVINQLKELINTKEQLVDKLKRKDSLNEQLERWEKDTNDFSVDNNRLSAFENVRHLFAMIKELDTLKQGLSNLEKERILDNNKLQELEAKYLTKEAQWSNLLNISFTKDNCVKVLSDKFQDIKEKQEAHTKAKGEYELAKKEEANTKFELNSIQKNIKDTKENIQITSNSHINNAESLSQFTQLTTSFHSLSVWISNQQLLVKEAHAIQTENKRDINEEIEVTKLYLENSYDEVSNKIVAIESKGNNEEINKQLRDLETKKAALNAGLEALSQIEQLNSELVGKKITIINDTKVISELVANIARLELNLSEIKNNKEQNLEILKLAAAALQYQEVRAQLIEGNPCPICGSTTHPGIIYQDYEYLKNKDRVIELQQKEIEDTLSNNKIKKAGLDRDVINNERIINQNQTKIGELLTTKIDTAGRLICISKEDITKENLTNSLTESKNEFNSLLEIQTELSQLSALNQQKNSILIKLDRCRKWLDGWNEFITILNANNVGTRNEVKIFLTDLYNKKKEYDILNEKREQLTNELNGLNATLTTQQESEKTALEQFTKRTTTLNNAKATYDNIKLIFDSLPIIEDAARISNTEIPIITRLIGDISNMEKTIIVLDGKINMAKSDLSSKQMEVLDNIMAKGYQTVEEIVQLNISPKEEEALRRTKQELATKNTEITTALKGLLIDVNTLNAKDKPELDIDTVRNELAEKEGILQSDNQKQWELTKVLNDDEEIVKQFQEKCLILENMKKDAAPYQNLNKYMGDADGDKFNEFAQELTLRKLLTAANANLAGMNQRYQLDVSEESESNNSIYVVDKYMGNSRRAADMTLSGGETFLASLSLALGLSDMAAGKAELGNLFIDEGFGSLDQESLDYSIGILEELQHKRGRVIGVISHVSELKEKIQTQIRIEKRAGGTSVIVPF